MRYFKYSPPQKSDRKIKKALVASLSAEEKKQYRKAKLLSQLGIIVFFLVFGTLFSLSVWFVHRFMTQERSLVLHILNTALRIAFLVLAVVVSLAVGALSALPFLAKYSDHYTVKRRILTNAAAHLRKYYEVSEPYLITKCYEASNELFIDHDVCLFFAHNELRITGNLDYGFLHAEKDLGCYAIKKEEISLRQIPKDTTYATELTADNVRFLLGARAKKFIERNFL